MKNGFTTGSCAQAAAQGACRMLIRGKKVGTAVIETPSGRKLRLPLADPQIGKRFAACVVIKRSGEEPDVTQGAKIRARVRWLKGPGFRVRGGPGIGKVTKPGLAVPVGEWAINPVPRKMILKELAKWVPDGRGAEVTLSVQDGKRIARRTYNPKLGIVGGISILGTTGIVEPKSLKAYQASLALELNVLKAQGSPRAVLVLGYVGEKYALETLKIKKDALVKIGDHVGWTLRQCVKKGFKKVLLIGHIGKMIKLANGQFDTHCRFGDPRISLMAWYAERCGAAGETVREILRQTTAEATVPILEQTGLSAVFERIAKDVSAKAAAFIRRKIRIRCVLLSLEGKVLGIS